MQLQHQRVATLLLVALVLHAMLAPGAALPISRRSKVAKRSDGVLKQPLRPVYHSPPINAFTLKDLEPRDDDSYREPIRLPKVKTNKIRTSSSNSRALYTTATIQPFPQYGSTRHQGEERYFGNIASHRGTSGITQVSGLDYGGGTGATDSIDFTGSAPDLGAPSAYAVGEGTSGLGGSPSLPADYGSQIYTTRPKAPKVLIPTYNKPATPTLPSYPQETIQHKDLFDGWSHTDANYEFSYQVIHHGEQQQYHKDASGKNEPQFFGHAEKREGPVTRGRYHVLLPDGRHQNVAYLANRDGYHAQVSYNR